MTDFEQLTQAWPLRWARLPDVGWYVEMMDCNMLVATTDGDGWTFSFTDDIEDRGQAIGWGPLAAAVEDAATWLRGRADEMRDEVDDLNYFASIARPWSTPPVVTSSLVPDYLLATATVRTTDERDPQLDGVIAKVEELWRAMSDKERRLAVDLTLGGDIND